MKKNKLPENLKYLEPVRKKLSQIPPDELNETTDADILAELLKKRIEGLSNEEADKVLSEHTEELATWLEDKHDSEYACHFIFGFLLGTDAEALHFEPESEPATRYVHAEFPEGFKTKLYGTSLNATNRNIIIYILPLIQEVFEDNKTLFFDAPSIVNALGSLTGGIKSNYNYEFSSINYSRVTGHKRTYIQNIPVFVKSLQYMLEVPGGYVSVMINSKDGKDFNEIAFESFLQTIEIKSNP